MNLHLINFQHLSLPSIIGLTGISLLLASGILRLLLSFKISKTIALIISLLIFILSYLSISGYSINFYLRGIFNDLSISSLILLSYYYISSLNTTPVIKRHTQPVFYLAAFSGLFFYPAALGLGAIDPYSWGFINKIDTHYSTLIFIFCLAGLMYFSLIKQYSLLLLCLVLSIVAYQSGLLESKNIWDYLLDPLIFIYALIISISQLIKKFK